MDNNNNNCRTSQQWWDETKQSEDKIIHWLKNQYHGEAVAAERIRKFILPTMEGKYQFMVERIADDEDRHSKWIGELLLTRGVTPKILQKEERYWKAVMTEDFSTNGNYAAAVAAHAEEMRLERIMVIMNDDSIEMNKMMDVKETFINIYKDELFHAKGFKLIAGDEYYNQASSNHAKGLEALGLIV
jgi:rubrerythrin